MLLGLGIVVVSALGALPEAAAQVESPFKTSYAGPFDTQANCETNRADTFPPGDPSVVAFPCAFATSLPIPDYYHGPGWYYRVRTDLA